MHVFPHLQVERVELTLRKNSSSTTATRSSYANAIWAILLAPTHFTTTLATHRSLGHRWCYSALHPNTRLFSVLRVENAPQHPWVRPPPSRLHPFPPPPAPRHPPQVARASAAALKRQRACTPGAASAAKQDSSHESVFSASQIFHLVSPHSATLPQANDLGGNSDSTEIAGGLEQRRFWRCHARIGTYSGAAATYGRHSGIGRVPRMIYMLSCRLLSGTQYTSVAV
jgi:hypothetical protein